MIRLREINGLKLIGKGFSREPNPGTGVANKEGMYSRFSGRVLGPTPGGSGTASPGLRALSAAPPAKGASGGFGQVLSSLLLTRQNPTRVPSGGRQEFPRQGLTRAMGDAHLSQLLLRQAVMGSRRQGQVTGSGAQPSGVRGEVERLFRYGSGKGNYSYRDPTIFEPYIKSAAQRYQVPEELIKAVIKVESNFNPRATSPKGAMGLMQLMPGTARDLGVRQAYDPKENIEGGTRYLRELLDRYGGNVPMALAAYNWGPGNLEKGRRLPQETRNYLQMVARYYPYHRISRSGSRMPEFPPPASEPAIQVQPEGVRT